MKSNSLTQPCAGWLQFLRAVTVCYKLDGAVQMFTSAKIRQCIERYTERITTEDIFEGAVCVFCDLLGVHSRTARTRGPATVL